MKRLFFLFMFIFWLSAYFYALAPALYAATLYSNTDGNVTNWTETYDAAGNCYLVDAGNYQRIYNTAALTNNCLYRYDGTGAELWTDYDFTFCDLKVAGDTYKLIHAGVRAQKPGITGYYFSHDGGNTQWVSGVAWGTVTTNLACVTGGRYTRIEIRGSGVATTIKIYTDTNATPTTLVYEASNPASVYDSGALILGLYVSNAYYTREWWPDNLLVEDQSAPATTPAYVIRRHQYNGNKVWGY